jgi:hypothetical protein
LLWKSNALASNEYTVTNNEQCYIYGILVRKRIIKHLYIRYPSQEKNN